MIELLFSSKPDFNKYPALVQDAIFIIESRYAFLDGIDDLANCLETSKPHLIRVFSRSCGISPGQYLIAVRLEHAKKMLRTKHQVPLEIVAAACGYSNANYFAKAFKKQTGITPSAFAASANHFVSNEMFPNGNEVDVIYAL
jgi:AraC-like DNA-binding protein